MESREQILRRIRENLRRLERILTEANKDDICPQIDALLSQYPELRIEFSDLLKKCGF